MRVAIIGQGYVGLTIAVGAAGAGHTVVGFDVNKLLVEQLNQGHSHIEGISDSAVNGFIRKGTYKASSDESVLEGSDVIVIAVPTPLDEKRNPDLSYVHEAAQLIAENVKSPSLIINESTSYPGTLRNEIAGRIKGVEHLFASSPERVDPGNTEWGTKNTPRLIGGLSPAAVAKARCPAQRAQRQVPRAGSRHRRRSGAPRRGDRGHQHGRPRHRRRAGRQRGLPHRSAPARSRLGSGGNAR